MEEESVFIASLIAKYMDGSISPIEMEQLFEHLSEEKLNEVCRDFQSDRIRQEILNLYFESRKEDAWKKIDRQKKQLKIRRFSSYKYIAVAAGILLLSMFSLWIYQGQQSQQEQVVYYNEIIPDHIYGQPNDVTPGKNQTLIEMANGEIINVQQDVLHITGDSSTGTGLQDNSPIFAQRLEDIKTIRTPRASNIEIVLPDQSQVWLNASSTLNIAPSFNRGDRRVHLSGEAFFQIAHDKNQRFRVVADQDTITVYGTSFNVNNYGKNTFTTLVEGKVGVEDMDRGFVELVPGYQAYRGRNGLTSRKVEVKKYVSWKEGYFYFQQDNLKYVLARLAEWYDIEIDMRVGQQPISISGTIDKNVALAEAVSILADVSGLNFRINNRILTITN